MEGLIIDELDASFDSIEWTEKNCSLSSFLDQHGSTLPHVVKVAEGFCGLAASCTIDSGQILILHSLRKETKILAKDAKDYDLFIPKKFQVKVEIVPKNSFKEYSTIQDLLRTFPNYFRVLDDIPSLSVTSGSLYQISRQNTSINHIECLQVGSEGNEDKVKFPLNLSGRFQPLQDSREFFLDEVLSEDNSIVTVHFVKSGVCGSNQVALDEMGNIRLMGECETQSVFATVMNSNGKSLAVFPKNLNITIQTAVIGSENYCKLREDVITNQAKTMRRLQRLNKLVLYQARNPVRQFPVLEILPPVLPKSRTQSLLDSCEGTSQDDLVKERSNSTPLLPTQPPKRSQTCKTTFKTTHKPLKEALSVPNKSKHPSYNPPPVPTHPTKQSPPLPPKDKSKPTVRQDSRTESPLQKLSLEGQLSPTKDTPTPPPRRRRKKKKSDLTEEIIDDEGYVKMNPDEMVTVLGEKDRIVAPSDVDKRVGCAYEQMEFPFLADQTLDQPNTSCLNNVQTASNTYEQMDPPYLKEKSNGAYEEMNTPYLIQTDPTKSQSDDDSCKTLEELFGDENKMNNGDKRPDPLQNVDRNHNTLVTEDTDTCDGHDYYNMKTLALTEDSQDVSDDYAMPKEHEVRPLNIITSSEDKEGHDYYNMKNVIINKVKTTEEVHHDNESSQNTSTDDKRHDYYNMKNLDLDDVNGVNPDHDYENTKSIEKARESGDGHGHDYENTKEFDASSLPRSSQPDTELSPTSKDSAIGMESSELRGKRQPFAYENTGLSNREVPTPHRNSNQTNVDEVISGNYEKRKSSSSNALDIDPLQMTATDDELASCFSETLGQTSPSSFRGNKSLTMTEQLVHNMTLRRPSPIGMEEEMINDEDVYTNMDENNTCADKCGKHGEYYVPMQSNDQTFQNYHGQHFYVPMNESLRRPDSGIYENEHSDQESGSRDSACYEEIDIPVNTRKSKRQALNGDEADVSSINSDSDNLHYHQVDLSSLALSLEDQDSDGEDEDIYEDIDMQEKPRQVSDRPTPPSRRARLGKSSKSEGEPPESGITSQDSLTDSVITSPKNMAKSAPACKTAMTPPTSPPRTLDKDQISKSTDFEYIDEMHLHIAIRESMENIKKANKSRPPAPPPKKLNYVKVEPLPGTKPGAPPKNTQQTNYSDIVGTEKPPKQTASKEDEMEYIDDCELHFSEIEKAKKQKKRKDQLKKQVEKDLASKTSKYGSPSSRDLKESPYINKIREDESRDKPTGNETVDSCKPVVAKRLDTNRLVQVLPRDFQPEKKSRDVNKSVKPVVPKKPKPRPETKKKPTLTTTTNAQNNAISPVTTDSVKKRAMIPPPKPKRTFVENNNEEESRTDRETESNSECANTQEVDNTTVQTSPQHQTEVTRKKPLPLPRKKPQGHNKTSQDS